LEVVGVGLAVAMALAICPLEGAIAAAIEAGVDLLGAGGAAGSAVLTWGAPNDLVFNRAFRFSR
jgi:hypothetical protein